MKQKLLDEIKEAGELRPEDVKELLSLLQLQIMRRVLCSILLASDTQVTMLANIDLTTDAGIKQAIRLQAQAHANATIVEDLLDAATKGDQDATGK